MEKNFFIRIQCISDQTDFEADSEIDVSSIGNRTPNIFKQNPVCKGYYIVSEFNDV